MLMVFVPIGACCSFIRFVVGDINPLGGRVQVRTRPLGPLSLCD